MRFLLDQDVPVDIARVLKQDGHNVLLLKECLPIDSDDESVLSFATARNRVMVTCNRDDFLELFKSRRTAGLIILIRRRTRIQECAKMVRLIGSAGEEGIVGNINFA